MKFFIRDLLWLTVVVALGVGWWVDRSRLAKANVELVTAVEAQKAAASWSIEAAKHQRGRAESLQRQLDELRSVSTLLDPSVPARDLPSDSAPGPVAGDKAKELSIELGQPVDKMFAALQEHKIEWREEGFAEARVRGSRPNLDIADIVFDLGDEMLARIYYSESQRVVTGITILVRPHDGGRKYHSTFEASRIRLEVDGSFSMRFSPQPKPSTR